MLLGVYLISVTSIFYTYAEMGFFTLSLTAGYHLVSVFHMTYIWHLLIYYTYGAVPTLKHHLDFSMFFVMLLYSFFFCIVHKQYGLS